jgi:hypothetical protein
MVNYPSGHFGPSIFAHSPLHPREIIPSFVVRDCWLAREELSSTAFKMIVDEDQTHGSFYRRFYSTRQAEQSKNGKLIKASEL